MLNLLGGGTFCLEEGAELPGGGAFLPQSGNPDESTVPRCSGGYLEESRMNVLYM